VVVKPYLGRIYTNLRGWRTKRKIVVIESDDWGSIRMPSAQVYNKCLGAGYPVDKVSYDRYDSLLSQDDLELLFEQLTKYKDKNGNHPVITANCVVANPDFERIRKDNFESYHYELIPETFKRYPAHANNFALWKEGIQKKIFFPQFHAREHLNVSLFMRYLQEGNREVHFGFDNGMPGMILKGPRGTGNYFVEASHYESESDKKDKLNIYLEGLDLFEGLFGYRSASIIPPNYTWSPDFDSAVLKKGVKIFQGLRKMKEPVPGAGNINHSKFIGKTNSLGQIYLVRNAIFEPSMFNMCVKDHVDRCLKEMSIAFRFNKPAIVTSHRINYSGFVDQNNRDRNLHMLDDLMNMALRRWPSIEFMTSDQLGLLIINEK